MLRLSDFEKAKCLMNCEVARLLEHKSEQYKQMSNDSNNHTSQVFEKSLQYVKRFRRFSNQDAVKQLALLGNLCPETLDEAISVIPTLKTKGRLTMDSIEKLVNDLSMIKKFE
ncbi:hypothetical protein QN277_012244 [Acacia crassicarpa]|uniref:RNA polymerase Rpb4/RPC9 core domain-containing protein n=1 Tax=Acacia crassicarpa TaxID=499986 RepID=A0AAE1N0B4_9FABA|nr:hypothetical protein QN277_012244 [Acacia crassicarpa]